MWSTSFCTRFQVHWVHFYLLILTIYVKLGQLSGSNISLLLKSQNLSLSTCLQFSYVESHFLGLCTQLCRVQSASSQEMLCHQFLPYAMPCHQCILFCTADCAVLSYDQSQVFENQSNQSFDCSLYFPPIIGFHRLLSLA